ncbi:MAG: hypothetical protein HQL39_16865 [Alphaproteobacteria bacterium]|nr:hypothetical protein [Alphaproteobacteria bacterium]
MTAFSARDLAGPLGALARAGHGGAALLIVKHWGGQCHYVGQRQHPGTPLALLVGLDAAQALADILWRRGGTRGGQLDVVSPAALSPAKKGDIARAEGTTREVARAAGVTERYVRLVRASDDQPARKERPRDPRQGSLLD